MKPSTIQALQNNFSGEIITPGDKQYEQASTVVATKGAPAAVVRPRTADDVAAAIQYARDNSLVISVRSGGHSNAGFGTNNGGVVIDLRHFNEIKIIDKEHGRVRLGSGATWEEVASTLQQAGLALSSGDTKSVGVGGLTLGAGVGWMVRKYGLTIDNLVSADMVTADGKLLHVSESEHSDLFWAIRGGGGNFGIVLNFEFVAHSIGKIYAGVISYKLDNLAELLKGWRDHMRAASEDLTTTFLLLPAFGDNPPAANVLCCFAGDDAEAANAAINPLLQIGTVLRNTVAEKEYADVLEESRLQPNVKVVVNNVFAQDFSDALIETIAKQNGRILQIRSVGGAMNRVAADATAFAHRDSEVLIIAPVFVPSNASEDEIAAALKPWRDIAAFGKGAYSNFFSEASDTEVTATYPPATYDRLAAIKKTYDPENVFSQNLNVRPA